MIIEENTLTSNVLIDNLIFDYNLEDIILFDIETTGLSHSKHMIYLIGYMYYINNSWNVVNLLATSYDDEQLIISIFLKEVSQKKCIIHFNGNTFDIPFINAKAKKYKINSPINNNSSIDSIDLYRLCKKHSSFLNLDNYKLKTIENAFGINRKDTFSGKELIEKYYDFIKIYSLDKLKNDFSNSNKFKNNLILHNYEDITNMLPLVNIFKYDILKNKHYSIVSYNVTDCKLIIQCELSYNGKSYSLPINLNCTLFDTYASSHIKTYNNNLIITIPIVHDELKYFYPDYKNYYYLPSEDTAIHKSVGTYVDKEFREQAKANTCYIKKQGSFIPTNNTSTFPVFKKDYSSKELFIELNDEFLQNNILQYIHDFI